VRLRGAGEEAEEMEAEERSRVRLRGAGEEAEEMEAEERCCWSTAQTI